ncbi:MAG: hypothetical protein LBR50_04165 [Tannerella sp.]|jgi:hypothetical protein|nr:hypothetical protein [Tannerella sp.]
MNKRIGKYNVIVNALAIFAVIVSGLIGSEALGYIACIVIALSFVQLTCTFAMYGRQGARLASDAAKIFAGVFAAVGLLVYTVHLTAILRSDVNILQGSLPEFLYSLDLLANCLMGVATFFSCIGVKVRSVADRVLKLMLMLNIVVAASCYIVPLYAEPIWGVVLINFWCIYFIALDILAFIHFSGRKG